MPDPAPIFLRAAWHDLVMVNFEVDPALLAPRVPAGTELDLWQGRALASVVGFRFLRTRVMGIPIPFHVNFPEVNLRFYVRRRVGAESRRGVVFVKEIVPRAAIAWVARTVYGETYVSLPMREEVDLPTRGEPGVGRAAYAWKRDGRWESVEAHVDGPSVVRAEGTEEAFVTEHYWGYAGHAGSPTTEYAVEHPRWTVRNAVRARLDCDVAALYGREFADALSGLPSSAFVADGSDVVVRRGRPLAVAP